MSGIRWNRFFKVCLMGIVLSAILFNHFYAPRFITEIRNPLVLLIKGSQQSVEGPSFEDTHLDGKIINFDSSDGVQLCSYLTYSSIDTVNGTIILLHGIRSSKEYFIGLSKRLSEVGYHTVALDLRAHGHSEGQHCTYGVKEKQDVSQLVNVLASKENLSQNIGIWGHSLGGAVALQVLAIDKRIKFGIVESAFSDYSTIVNDYFDYNAGFNFRPLTDYLVARSGKIAGFDPDDARPSYHSTQIDQPMLVVHGNKDARINIKYGRENFNNLQSKDKTFLEVEDANHIDVWKVGGKPHFEKVMQFINRVNAVKIDSSQY